MPDCHKGYRRSYLRSSFLYSHYTSLNGTYFNLEYCGVEPKTEAVPFLSPIYSTQHHCLYWSWTLCVPDQALFVVWFEPILPLILSRKLTAKSNLVSGPHGLRARQCLPNQEGSQFDIYICRFCCYQTKTFTVTKDKTLGMWRIPGFGTKCQLRHFLESGMQF